MVKYDTWKIEHPKEYKKWCRFYGTEKGFLRQYNKLKERDRFLREESDWKAYQFTDEGWIEWKK